MRRRFRQNQEDCTFVLLAQLPTLARQLFAELDVEALTAELQRRAEVAKRDKLSGTAIESSTASLDASGYLESGLEDVNGNSNIVSSTHATLEAAQVPLPQEGATTAEPETAQEVSREIR